MKITELEKYRSILNIMITQAIVPQSEFGKHTDDSLLQVTVHAMDATTITVNANRTFQLVMNYVERDPTIKVGDAITLNTRTGEVRPVRRTSVA